MRARIRLRGLVRPDGQNEMVERYSCLAVAFRLDHPPTALHARRRAARVVRMHVSAIIGQIERVVFVRQVGNKHSLEFTSKIQASATTSGKPITARGRWPCVPLFSARRRSRGAAKRNPQSRTPMRGTRIYRRASDASLLKWVIPVELHRRNKAGRCHPD